MGAYQGGARTLDTSGELKGDLLREGREMSWIFTADSAGNRPRATFTWGAVVEDGTIYVPDINTGLWIHPLRSGDGLDRMPPDLPAGSELLEEAMSESPARSLEVLHAA
ncbi:MAG: hypothetical protein ABIQ49_08540 [Gemmatimonadales bacterium]